MEMRGHASNPKAINRHAILEIMGFIGDLQTESNEWLDRFSDGEFATPTITPTAIEAKTGSPNRVSDHAEATFDLRTIPSFHQEAFDTIKKIADKRGISLSLIYPPAPTAYTDPKARLIQTLNTLVPNLHLEVSQASADLGFMTELGVEGIIFGPGEKSQMHITDESVPLNHLQQAVDIYLELYYAWARGN